MDFCPLRDLMSHLTHTFPRPSGLQGRIGHVLSMPKILKDTTNVRSQCVTRK